jgi:hypothetical protein
MAIYRTCCQLLHLLVAAYGHLAIYLGPLLCLRQFLHLLVAAYGHLAIFLGLLHLLVVAYSHLAIDL